MKIVVDTNIVFSAIIKPSSKISRVLLNSKRHFQLYSCTFLKDEILSHKDRLIKITGLSSAQLEDLEKLIIEHITFINEFLIPQTMLLEAEDLVRDIDVKDTVFVALASYLDATLWSGDKKLIGGLESKGYDRAIDTTRLFNLFDDLEK